MLLTTLIFLFLLSSIFWGPVLWLVLRVRRALAAARSEAPGAAPESPAGEASARQAGGPDLVVPYRVIRVER